MSRRASALASSLCMVVTLALAGCGFQPLYGELGASPALARIAVITPDTRTGFVLRQQLEDALAFDRNQAPLWRLETAVEQERTPLGRRIDDTVTRYQLTLVVNYALSPAAGGRPYTGAVTATTTYAAADQAYAGVAAQRDGEERAVAEAARLLRLDLARLVGQPAQP
jgi:LPS-assembly lipoprotein